MPTLKLLIFDWGDTVMAELPDFVGKMVDAPHVEALPGIGAALAELQPHYRMVLASNANLSGPADIRAALHRVNLDAYFEAFFASSVMGAAKPDPAFFEIVLRECGCVAHEAACIGDTFEKDIIGGKQAGLRAIWYNWKNAIIPADSMLRPDATIIHHDELAAAVHRLAHA
ncbi:MAG: HAD-IA family hydrolase [Chloroflexi bacterium]|nr:HAD-IA family hydrolase [Chloroflexota bacterium]